MSAECEHCGTSWTPDESDAENGLCPDCNDEVMYCNDCNAAIFEDDAHVVNDEVFCLSCYDENFTQCCSCGDVVSTDYVYYYSGWSGTREYCEYCYSEEVFCCQDCGEDFLLEEENYHYDDFGYGPYCNACWHESHGCNNNINSWDFKPSFRVFLGKKESIQRRNGVHVGKGIPTFGFEIELNAGVSDISTLADTVLENDNEEFYYMMEDGSLDNGFEIASHPFTLASINENQDRLAIFHKLSKMGAKSYSSDDCGMHIHIGRRSFVTKTHLYKFSRFIYENKEFIKSLADRQRNKLHQWATIDLGENEKKQLARWCSGKDSNTNRYVALNFQNHATIECRIFRGTLAKTTIMRNIEFLHSLFMMTKNSDIKHLRTTDLERFVVANANVYPRFAAYLDSCV